MTQDGPSVSEAQGVTAPVHVEASQTQPISSAHAVCSVFAPQRIKEPTQVTGHEQYAVASHDPSVVKLAHEEGVPLHPLEAHVHPAAVHSVSPNESPRTAHAGIVPWQGPSICAQPGQYPLDGLHTAVGHSAHVGYMGLPLQPWTTPGAQPGHSPEPQSSHDAHVEVKGVPMQRPTLVSVEHPGQLQDPRSSKQPAHVLSRVAPVHEGVAAKSTGGGGRATVGDLQQISPKQSLSCVHVVAQVAEHSPLQQMRAPGVCSHWADDEQALGHAWTAGFRQRPDTPRLGSTACTVVQQISPSSVLHRESSVHEAGHCSASVQMGRS